jgi:hypothetical protein
VCRKKENKSLGSSNYEGGLSEPTFVRYDTVLMNAKGHDSFSLSFYKECEAQCCCTTITDLTCATNK